MIKHSLLNCDFFTTRSITAFLAVVLPYLMASSSMAANFTIKNDEKSIVLAGSSQWKLETNFMGFDTILLGPYQDNFRPSMSLNFTGIQQIPTDLEKLKSEPQPYYQQRQQWAENKGFKFVGKVPAQILKLKSGLEIFTIGFDYQNHSKKLREQTYYFLCSGEMLHLKSLVAAEHSASLKEVSAIIESLACEAKS